MKYDFGYDRAGRRAAAGQGPRVGSSGLQEESKGGSMPCIAASAAITGTPTYT
ncbi:hypothetical protein EC845_0402 [Comamonas sp. BIGb0124]|nr:hypothetical protein EC845_0402 [Comamonas sp. BIGb0124]